MNTWHPFKQLSDGWTVAAFVVLLGLTAFTMYKTKGRLTTEEAPNNAISLELAGSAERANAIIGSWKKAEMLGEARRHLWWDSLAFIPAYSTFAALACVMAARAFFRTQFEPLYDVALVVAWLPWLAGLCDYVENGAMCAMLGGFSGETWPRVGWWAAFVKFVILIPVFTYALLGAGIYVLKWLVGLFRGA